MDEGRLYRELVSWLRSHHPLVFAQWERKRRDLAGPVPGERHALQAPPERIQSGLDALPPDASVSAIVKALKQELEKLGIGGGTPGVTSDGTPCIHLMKHGVYGSAYEESVTLARLRDPGYRRHLKQVFG
jgi:hypothetical protein